jgi:hypothetical protein
MNGRQFNGGGPRELCWRGHLLAHAYLTKDGTRVCRRCKLDYQRRAYARKKAAA